MHRINLFSSQSVIIITRDRYLSNFTVVGFLVPAVRGEDTVPVECQTHDRYEEDHEHNTGADDDGQADHDGGVLELLLPHGRHEDPVTVPGDDKTVSLSVV